MDNHQKSKKSAIKRVLLDVDVGIDDYVAILLLLQAEKAGDIKIEGIICSMGNTSVDNVCKNVMRLLEVTKRTDIPVFRGATEQFIPFKHSIQHYHGSDGFGDVLNGDYEPDLSRLQPQVGAVAMRDIVVNNPNEITLICLAALTNVALAIKLDDGFASKLKEIWIMGGNYTAVGNITAAAEYNFYIDPEAAYIVLDCIRKPIHILTWETCLYTEISWDWRLNVFGKTTNPAIALLNKAQISIKENIDEDMWIPCDAFLAAAFICPKVVKKRTVHHASVELSGQQTRGQIVLDHLKSKKSNVTIIEQVDSEIFKELLLNIIKE